MKTQKYDWMLIGCHSVAEIASVYFRSDYSSSNARSLKRLIKCRADFYAEMLEAEYNEHDSILTPMQIAIIIRHMGLPDGKTSELNRE